MSCKRAVLFAVLLSCAAGWVAAQTLEIASHISIAPISIPINKSGVSNVGVTRVAIRPSASGTLKLSKIDLQATTSGTFDPAWVSSIQVWFEPNAGITQAIGEWDRGGSFGDVRADTGAVTFNALGAASLNLNPATVTITRPPGALAYLYVVCNFSASANTSTNFGCEVTKIYYGVSPSSSGLEAVPTPHGTRRHMDDNEAALDASWRSSSWITPPVPASVPANASKVPVLKLQFAALDSAINAITAPVQLDKVRVHLTYGQDNWVSTGGVLLYIDDGDGVFEPDGGDGAYVASATLSGGYALLDPVNIPITSTGKTCFVAVNLNGATAQVGQRFGLNINNPSTDIIFSDEIDDDAVEDAASPEYAWVPYTASNTYEYIQLGYITSTTADPEEGIANTFIIDPPDDGNPPRVSTTLPGPNETNVSRNADITVLFSEDMKESSVEDPPNFTITGGIIPTAFDYTAATKTLVITLPTLAWGTAYTATVKAAVQDFYGNAMGADYSWSFTVEPARHPIVLSTVPESGATNVVRNTQVAATFSEDVTGVSGISFKLWEGPVAGVTEVTTVTVAYDDVNWVATMTLDTGVKLKYSTQYWATLNHNLITDSDGLKLADQIIGGTEQDKAWTFYTVSASPPSVISVTPTEDATGVPITGTIRVVFSKPVDATTLAGNITVQVGGAPVSGTISPSTGNTSTATFTPASPLDYLKTYTVMVGTGVLDTDGIALSAPKTWSFTTFGFTKATIVNNRLGAGGGASETLIFVPQAGASDKVSVQVFTTKGRLVRTFYKNAAFSSVAVPIRWNGTNDMGKPLGPGLYFVQIVVGGTKQVLKVLIVR